MKCPKCDAQENIKWFLRHQPEGEDDTSDLANVITILCTECGYNQTFYLVECLDDIFPDWSEEKKISQDILYQLFNQGVEKPEDSPETTDEVVEETTEEE